MSVVRNYELQLTTESSEERKSLLAKAMLDTRTNMKSIKEAAAWVLAVGIIYEFVRVMLVASGAGY